LHRGVATGAAACAHCDARIAHCLLRIDNHLAEACDRRGDFVGDLIDGRVVLLERLRTGDGVAAALDDVNHDLVLVCHRIDRLVERRDATAVEVVLVEVLISRA
jgi:hypothetical protein